MKIKKFIAIFKTTNAANCFASAIANDFSLTVDETKILVEGKKINNFPTQLLVVDGERLNSIATKIGDLIRVSY